MLEEPTIKDIKTLKKPRKSKEYLNNKDLYDEIVKSKEQGELTKNAQKMLVLQAERAISKHKYVSEDDRNDSLAFGRLDLLKYCKSFKRKTRRFSCKSSYSS
jgi:hypothetical protein